MHVVRIFTSSKLTFGEKRLRFAQVNVQKRKKSLHHKNYQTSAFAVELDTETEHVTIQSAH